MFSSTLRIMDLIFMFSIQIRVKNEELKNEIDRLKNVLAMKEEIERNQIDTVWKYFSF